MAPGRLTYDVVVVGGGAAGLAAALTAAGAGARTALVERYGFLGGMATAGMVGTICGLYHVSTHGEPELVNDGLAASFASRLSSMPGCDKPIRRGRTFVLPYTPYAFACLADELTSVVPALDVYLHAWCVGVTTTGTRIGTLSVSTSERTVELEPHVVIDATGDAVVAHRAGAATEMAPPSERQLPSIVFVLQQVDVDALAAGARVALLRLLAAAEREGRAPRGASSLVFAPSPQSGEVVCKLALDHIADGVHGQRDFMTSAEQQGRKRAAEVVAFLKTLRPFSRAFVSHVAPQVGVRESRRLVGRYQLTRDDVLAGRRFDDAVARACWPIELWEENRPGATYEYLADGETYDIPLASLQPRELEGLYVVGRCMSATHEALGSARVIGTCLAVGAGVGAAATR